MITNGNSSSNDPDFICDPVIVVHGGAWKIPSDIHEHSALGVRDAAVTGHRVLKNGGSCIDAVVKAVEALEDNPYFDAGHGSVLNEAGEVEMHALVMRGDTCDMGGCLCIKHVKNPVKAARLILDESHHCLLSGEAALTLARQHGLEERPLEYFITDESRKEMKDYKNYSASIHELFDSQDGHDTVGAVALDCHGNLACATSTGGINAQKVGRISDSPIGGSGGFADNNSIAVSTTGHGESIMKVNLARMISMYVEHGMSPQQATMKSLNHMKARVGGSGGAISVDGSGRVGVHFTTQNMSWARVGGKFQNETTYSNDCVQFGTDCTNFRTEKI
ncbi:isoaspartyl peptidase/L-asparaginase-like [Clavelina lepadiformis]|uniref:isoaspartyl peptidase/L-asparaginase-like n=1 Tax=Clavelina lepadiformis TaxID=159417 RepID=UPI004042F1F3